MSKNLTRKGLALGAIVALGSTLFAGTAAHAAEELTLAPSTGTLYKTVEGEAFTLLAGLAPATSSANIYQLKYQVTSAATLGTPQIAADASGAAAAQTGTPVGGTQPTNTTVYIPASGDTPTAGQVQTIALTATSVAAGTPATATVTAFFDANSNNLLDSGEYTSAARTITWVDAADLVATVTLGDTVAGTASVKATVVLEGINQSQVSENHIGIFFSKNDGTTLLAGTTNMETNSSSVFSAGTAFKVSTRAADSSSYSATSATLAGGNVLSTTLANNSSVRATVYFNVSGAVGTAPAPAAAWLTAGASKAAPADIIGTKLGFVGKTVKAATVLSLQASVAASANSVENLGDENAAATATSTAVRADSKVTVTGLALDKTVANSGAAVASAAVAGTVSLTNLTLSASKTLTVNGTTYTSNTALTAAMPLALTTNADGKVTVDVTTAGLASADLSSAVINVSLAAQNLTSSINLNPVALAYTVVDLGARVNANTYRSVAKGTTATFDYQVVDQFKQNIADGFRLVGTTSSVSPSTVITAGTTNGTVTGGKGSLSFTPAAVGTFVVAVTLEKSTGGVYASQAATAPSNVTVDSVLAADLAVSAAATHAGIATSATAPYSDVAKKAVAAVDVRTSFATPATINAKEKVTIAGTVSEKASGATTAGAKVTISGKGLLFIADAGQYYADSITVYATAGGDYSVTAATNLVGSYTVTVTSGTASATATAVFKTRLAAAGIKWVTALDAQAQSGRSVDVSAQVVDVYGNAYSGKVTDYSTETATAVTVTYTLTGAGYLQATSAAANSDNAGLVTNRLISQASDLGTATVAASITVGTDTYKASSSVEFGITDVTDISSAGKAIYVNTEFAKGKVVTVFINGKRMPVKAAETTDNAVERKYTQKKAGKYTVTVRISGGVVASQTEVIK